jgi:hypothetical protein
VLNLHRGSLFRTIAVVVLAGVVVGSLLTFAIASVTATVAIFAGPTPTAPTSTAPVSTPSAEPAAPTDPSTAPTATPTASATPSPGPTSAPAPKVREFFVAAGIEPSVAADPFHPGLVAVVSGTPLVVDPKHGCSRPAVRVSRDDGATWGAATYPWGPKCQDLHAVIAWGPASRLWAGDAMGTIGGLAMSLTYSDDSGATWSKPFVEGFTKPWVGCYPSITVDNWPDSPNFGTVYVAYNWLPDGFGPGVAVMASKNGTAWVHTEVSLDSMAGYPFSWRIGYRIAAAPDGTAFVSFYQSSLKYWDPDKMLSEGSASNIGRIGFQVALLHFDGNKLTADKPAWVTSVDQTAAQWQSGLAVDDAGRAWMAVETHGGISVGRLDGGWTAFSIPGQSSYKASLAISGRMIFVGWHATDAANQVWTYYSLSHDGGATFLPPALVTKASWSPAAATAVNGVGLRENADFRNGIVYYAYGDARSGTAVYLAQIRP